MKDFYDNLDFIDASKTPIYIYEFSFFGKFNVLDRFITKNVPPLSKVFFCWLLSPFQVYSKY